MEFSSSHGVLLESRWEGSLLTSCQRAFLSPLLPKRRFGTNQELEAMDNWLKHFMEFHELLQAIIHMDQTYCVPDIG